jgi:hypothetical protein
MTNPPRISLGLCALVTLSACVQQTAGTTVSIEVIPADDSSFLSSNGEEVNLEQAWLTLGGMELIPCDSLSSSLGRWLAPLWPIGTAHAHIGDAPTRIGSPLVLDLVDASKSVAFGVLSPPAQSYCSLDVWVIPADDDSRGLPSDTRMDTRTFMLLGEWTSADTTTSNSLRILGADSAIVNLPFETALELDPATPTATLQLRPAVSTWFEGLTLETTSGVEQSRAIMENIALGFELHVNSPEN